MRRMNLETLSKPDSGLFWGSGSGNGVPVKDETQKLTHSKSP